MQRYEKKLEFMMFYLGIFCVFLGCFTHIVIICLYYVYPIFILYISYIYYVLCIIVWVRLECRFGFGGLVKRVN